MADITYGTNNEFGFDYLRDNMVTSLDQRVQRSHVYAIVDEVDSVLIDEARTPLIISGPVGNEGDVQYFEHNTAVSRLVRKQMELVNVLVADAERELEAGRRRTPSIKLYQAQLGHPKNRRLLKLMNEQGNKQLVQKMELEHLADRKLPPAKQAFRDIEEDLLFVLDERGHSVHLTDRGVDFMAPSDHDAYILPDLSEAVHRIDHSTELTPEQKIAERRKLEIEYAGKSERLNIVHQLLRAHALYEKDVNYVVQDGEVLIVDEYTGRTMPGRRWSEGLHQAVEAKEGVRVKGETQTMATITIQNYFRMYEKLAGMTGTAETEETEFFEIYKLEVAVIPTNRDGHPRRPARPRLQDAPREVQRHRRRDAPAARARLSGAHRHDERGRVGDAVEADAARRHGAQRPQREVPPARGGDRRERRPAGRDHDRDEHGRPRHRHQTRRRRHAVEAVDGEGSRRQGRRRDGDGRPAHRRLGAPRVAAHRPPAARPRRDVRAIRARASSSCRSRTT